MSGAVVKSNFPKLERVLKRYGDFAVKRVLRGIGQMVVTQTLERFDTQTSPEGKPWKPTQRGGNILRDTSTLYNSIHYKVFGNALIVGTDEDYAVTHQFGMEIKPKKPSGCLVFFVPGVGQVFAKKVRIPARPYLGVNEEDKAEIKAFIRRVFAEYNR